MAHGVDAIPADWIRALERPDFVWAIAHRFAAVTGPAVTRRLSPHRGRAAGPPDPSRLSAIRIRDTIDP